MNLQSNLLSFYPSSSSFSSKKEETTSSCPKGLILYKGAVDLAEQIRLLKLIESQPWSTTLSRRTQHYGARYDYKSRTIIQENDSSILPMSKCPFPSNEIVQNLFKEEGKEEKEEIKVDQCIINEYLSKQSISAHTDASCFGPIIVTVSLLNSTTLTFTHPTLPSYSVLLEPGDILVLKGEARTEWKHETKPITRKDYKRISLTYRTIN